MFEVSAQSLAVGLLVAWAGVYAAWVLMPAPLRRALLRLLQRCSPRLARRVAPSTEGGCGGCGGGCGPGNKPVGGGEHRDVQPIQLHLKRRG